MFLNMKLKKMPGYVFSTLMYFCKHCMFTLVAYSMLWWSMETGHVVLAHFQYSSLSTTLLNKYDRCFVIFFNFLKKKGVLS